jgi:predicted lipoprotein with Yx(FWY)xxD motif
MRARAALLGVVLLGGLAACGAPASTSAPQNPGQAPNPGSVAAGVKVGDSGLGPILTDLNGRTLYAFVNDRSGNSTCTNGCLGVWPALTSDKAFTAGDGTDGKLLGETKQTDGVDQAKYGVWPLYYYAGDQGPGDIDGQNVDGLWFVVGADGKLVKKTL